MTIGIRVAAILIAAAAALAFSSGAEARHRGHHRGHSWFSRHQYFALPGLASPHFVRPDDPLDRSRRYDNSKELNDLIRACDQQKQDLAAWPIKNIEQRVRPDDSQRVALDEVESAADKAADMLQATCPVDLPRSLIGRVDSVKKSLSAALQSLDIVGPPVRSFYNSLDEEQRASLIVMMSRGNETRSPDRSILARTCEDPTSIKPLKWPIEQMKYALRPTEAQRTALEEYWTAANNAAKFLNSVCPTETPLSPPARLDVMHQRLNSILQAVESIRPALGNLYDLLSDGQKARLDRMT